MEKIIGLGFGLLFFMSSANAVDFGIGAKAGITGVGLDLTVGLTKTINLRLAAARVDIDDEEETVSVGDDGNEADIDAELEFDFGSNAILLDWHVFNGGFRVTAGMFKHTGGADFSGQLQGNIVVDGQPLATDDLGSIDGEVKLSDSYQPYVGIGWAAARAARADYRFRSISAWPCSTPMSIWKRT